MSSVPCSRSLPGFWAFFFSVIRAPSECLVEIDGGSGGLVYVDRLSAASGRLPGGFAVVGSLVPDVGVGDLADGGVVAGLADGLAAGIGEAPLADVDGETEAGDQRAAGHVGVLFVARDVGARLLDQLLHRPRGHVA